MDKNEEKILKRLIDAIELYYKNFPKKLLRDFTSGLAYGLGATLGVAILLAILGLLLKQLGAIPYIGQFFQHLFLEIPKR